MRNGCRLHDAGGGVSVAATRRAFFCDRLGTRPDAGSGATLTRAHAVIRAGRTQGVSWSGGQLGALGGLGAARSTSELDVFLAVRDLDRSNAHGLFASWANPYGRGRRGVELAWLGHGASSCWYRRIAPWSRGTRGLYFCTSTEPFGEIRNPDGAISRLALCHREAGPRPQHVRFARTQRELALLEDRARKGPPSG
jgi:hypothetical protein